MKHTNSFLGHVILLARTHKIMLRTQPARESTFTLSHRSQAPRLQQQHLRYRKPAAWKDDSEWTMCAALLQKHGATWQGANAPPLFIHTLQRIINVTTCIRLLLVRTGPQLVGLSYEACPPLSSFSCNLLLAAQLTPKSHNFETRVPLLALLSQSSVNVAQ